MPGRVAAIEQSTTPQTSATKNAYWCSRPRSLGLPRSAGFIRNGAEVVTAPGYGTVGYSRVVKPLTPFDRAGWRS